MGLNTRQELGFLIREIKLKHKRADLSHSGFHLCSLKQQAASSVLHEDDKAKRLNNHLIDKEHGRHLRFSKYGNEIIT